MAPGKRKRERGSVDNGDNRPSPHRPGNTALGRHDSRPDLREGGGRRSSRGGQGGQGGRGRRESTHENPNNLAVSSRIESTSGPMSPPPPRPSSAHQTPTLSTDLYSPAMAPDPEPYDYTYITDSRISLWNTSGRREIIEFGSHARDAEEIENRMELSSIFQELVRAALDSKVEAAEVGSCIREILGPDTASEETSSSGHEAQDLFIDTISMIADIETIASAPKSRNCTQVLRTLTVSTGISPLLLRQKLDATLVQSLGLTRDTFIRVGIRQATHLLYRQANYNLLREETEGYSKLVTELFTTSGAEPPSAQAIQDAFERVKGLIGTFDLDVGRVLDITMDVFAALLIKHYRFFIKLLRVSSWWPRKGETDGAIVAKCTGLPKWALPSSPGWLPTEEDEEEARRQRVIRDTNFWMRAREIGLDAFFELGGREIVDSETKQRLLNLKRDDTKLDADLQWIEGTGTLPPAGNRTAAQLLGFKLRFYSSPARDKADILPHNLIYLTALLIKIGFISLRDLYPHLWPLDEDMENVRELRRKELEEKERLNRPGGATNALMMAGALVDDTLPNGGRNRETVAPKTESVAKGAPEALDEDKPDEPLDQKVQLLINLLTIGALPEALFMLGRFPWLPEAYPELLDLIHRILNYSLKDVYETIRPPSNLDVPFTTKEVAAEDQTGIPRGQVRLASTPTRKLLRWPFPDKHDTNESSSYRFYWDEWADNIPLCQCVEDVFTLCGTLLNYSGVNIGKDAALLSKLARIGAASLSHDQSKSNLDRWQDLLKRLLVPALSLTKANTSVVNEIYEMLRFYPASIRYTIYAEWFEGQISRLPAMKTAFARTRLETLSIMKRISMTNLTAMAKSLAKAAYASPGIVFSVALSQIEAYTNLTKVVVECARYFSDLGYDVLVWSLMSSLGGKDRNRTNAEYSLLPSRWLLALSKFSGEVFKRYSIMNPSPILHYVNDQLYRGNATDLVILKELIRQMAGVVPDTDFTDAQLTAMTGGALLRRQTLINLQDRRFESEKTAKRLMKALTETRLAGQLLLSIAQHRQSAIYSISDSDAHIKVLATMIDDTQMMLFQYLDLLRSNLPVEDFDKHVPSIPELLTDFGLDPSLAFMIGRTSFSHRMSNPGSPKINGGLHSLASSASLSVDHDTDGDTAMEEAMDGVNLPSTTEMSTIETNGGSPAPDSDSRPSSFSHELIQSLISAVQHAMPLGTWKDLTPEFYVTFWLIGLNDLSTPNKSYEAEMVRLTAESTRLEKDSNLTRPAKEKRDAEVKALKTLVKSLLDEAGKQMTASSQMKRSILLRKSLWFEQSSKADSVSDAILEKCLLPRILLSPTDATFCFKIVKFLHESSTPNFRTLSLYNKLFKANRLRSIIFTCTVREAENFGRFLRLVLADLARWHADSQVYQREAWGKDSEYHGFAKSIDADGKPKGLLEHDTVSEAGGDGKPSVGFKSLLLMWHKGLNAAIRDCLGGTEWMHIRNAITVLKTVADVFPAVNFMGNGFITQLETITKREKDIREDLSLTGNAVLVQLKKKAPKWVIVQAFGSNIAGQTNGGAKAVTPVPSVPTSTLKATAAEFKPQSRASSIGATTPKPIPAEVEDGEVDDNKTSSTTISQNTGKEPSLSNAADVNKSALPVPSSEPAPKSEVLARREQILREKQANAAAFGHSRTEPSRSQLLPERANHTLPTRPDAPLPPPHRTAHILLDRHQPLRHGDRRDGRDSRPHDPNRLDRPGDRPRDFSGDRRTIESSSRDFARPSDRTPDRERIRDPPPRWTPESAQKNQEKQRAIENRASESSGRLSRESGMLPPRSGAAAGNADRGPPINPERLPLVNADRAEIINPERQALIAGTKSPPRSDSPRRVRDDNRERGSRPQSPRRHGSQRDHSDPRRNDHLARDGPLEPYNSSHGQPDEILPPPQGPRSERLDRGSERGPQSDRSRDVSAFQGSQPSPRVVDPDHGRLVSGGRQQPDPNFGRLNASTNDIPSGPRDRNQRGNRLSSAPQSRREGRADLPRPTEAPRPPTPEIPTGPSSTRHNQPSHPRHAGSGQFDASSPTTSTAPTQAPVSSAPIHPSRLQQLGQTIQSHTAPPPPVPAGVHPDRLRAMGNDARDDRLNQAPTPPSAHVGNNRMRPSVPAVVTSGPPAGPKGSQSSPLSSGVNGFNAPTGPASASERVARGPKRQLAGINNMLQQAGQQNGSENVRIRGRGSRMGSSGYMESPSSTPSTPILPPPPPPGPSSGRSDPSRDMVNPERADLITGTGAVHLEERDRERSGRRGHGSGRHSRRTSKSPVGERHRDSKRGLVEEGHGPREHRRDSGRGDPSERDRHQSRDMSRDLMGGRDMANVSGRERERDREHRDPNRNGRDREAPREMHDTGFAGGERGGRHRGEDRRDRRGGEDGARKRHTEEGTTDRGREKRPRRN
ncbi:transcription factor/nuclear export subunit protein 2-domain-containing protein [Bisporella sp. PMI_857]|nr:transcription factor/nuclear export subunit protein 2-domain-containing protein [Bisporella sp. PMI_857]